NSISTGILMPHLNHVQLRRNTLAWSLLCVTCLTTPARALADPAISCDNLNVALSSDKSYYIFTVSASGGGSTIAGYTFDFGDHQSYTITFDGSRNANRQTASVTHVYRATGAYIPSVRIDLASPSSPQAATVTSSNCQTNLTVAPSADALPNTGAGDLIRLLTMTAFTGTITHQFWLRRRLYASMRKHSAVR
ncbi:MAG TPA: hypothetical protein VMB52_02580, partial [Verrucomicrobiae bacterium]|nr:hypothetical protein [Verrucomicrobiae bacterium]